MGKGNSVGKGIAIGAAAVVGLGLAVFIGMVVWYLVAAYPIDISVSVTPGDVTYLVSLSKTVPRAAKLEIRELEGAKAVLETFDVAPSGATTFAVPTYVTSSKLVAVLTETESGKVLGKSDPYKLLF